MYQLKNGLYISRGLHRQCYVHPEDPSLCIKVVFNGDLSETRREQRYYRMLSKKDIPLDLLPKFYGNVETNLGKGAVFDLIRDTDKNISQCLTYYLKDPLKTKEIYNALLTAMCELKSYLLMNHIITMTLKPKNILAQLISSEKVSLVIVDNIGNSDFVPVASYFTPLAHRKIKRKWKRFEMSLIKEFSHNPYVIKLIKEMANC